MTRFDSGFAGRVALVTGGASGIGCATARLLAREGAEVVVGDLDETRGKGVAEEIGGSFVSLDVSDPDAWRRAVAQVVSQHGGIDIGFLNAGVTTHPTRAEDGFAPFDIASLDDDRYRRVIGTNLDGVVFGARALTPVIESRGGGALVATASVAGVYAFAPDPIYTATKHAVVGLVRSLAPSLEARGVHLHAVLPGLVDTGLLAPGFSERARERGVPMLEAGDIANAVKRALTDDGTGRLWICVAGREPYPYEFASIAGFGHEG